MFRIICLLLLSLGFALAQDFSGTYTQQDDPSTVLELSVGGSGYVGSLLDGEEAEFRLEGFVEGAALFGTIFLTEANFEEDLFFGAEFSGEQLLLTTAFMNANGGLDEATVEVYAFVRSQASANPLGQATNPLVQPGGSSGQAVNPLGQAAVNPESPANPLAAAPVAIPANAVTLQANQQYQAGSVLYSPWTGVSFSVPAGFVAAYEPSEGVFVVIAQDRSRVLIVEAASQASATQLGGAVLEEVIAGLNAENPVFVVAGPEQQADTLAISYNVDGYTLRASARQGGLGNAAVVAGYALDSAALTASVDALSAAISFSQPQTTTQNSQLGGTDFYSNKADNYYSPGGVGDGSLVSGTTRSYSFCTDGRYAHEYSSKTFFSVEGVGGSSSEETDEHQGRWALSQTLMGSNALLLEASDGRAFVYMLEQVPEGVLVDGFLYEVSASQQCN